MGWYTENNVKTKKELVEKLKTSYGNNFISSSIKDDHIWILYKDNNVVNATCYLTDEKSTEDIAYKPISIESHPYKYDVPKSWINQITDVEGRENGYRMKNFKTWMNNARNHHNIKIREYYYPELNNSVTYTGKIENLKHLIVTDPYYGKDIWCRYEKEFSNPNDWDVKLIINNRDYFEKYKNMSINMKGLDFVMLLKNTKIPFINDVMNITNKGTTYSKAFKKNETTIGMDTAQVSFGVNENAKEVSDYYKDYDNDSLDLDGYRPYFSLETLTDGVFGNVEEYQLEDTDCAIKIDGWLDDDTDYDAEKLLSYLVDRMQIKELKKENNATKEQEGGDLNYG